MPNSPDSNHLDQPDHWRKLAAEMRADGADMVDHIAKQKMHEAAGRYDALANHIEMRGGSKTGRQVVKRRQAATMRVRPEPAARPAGI